MKEDKTKTRLEAVVKLTSSTPQQTQEIFKLYRELMNPQFVGCATCSASVKQAFTNIKQYYQTNYGKTKKD